MAGSHSRKGSDTWDYHHRRRSLRSTSDSRASGALQSGGVFRQRVHVLRVLAVASCSLLLKGMHRMMLEKMQERDCNRAMLEVCSLKQEHFLFVCRALCAWHSCSSVVSVSDHEHASLSSMLDWQRMSCCCNWRRGVIAATQSGPSAARTSAKYMCLATHMRFGSQTQRSSSRTCIIACQCAARAYAVLVQYSPHCRCGAQFTP